MPELSRRLQLIEAAIEVLKREGAPETPMAILESWFDVERRFDGRPLGPSDSLAD